MLQSKKILNPKLYPSVIRWFNIFMEFLFGHKVYIQNLGTIHTCRQLHRIFVLLEEMFMSSEMVCIVINVTKNTSLSNTNGPDPKAWRYFWRYWRPTRSYVLFLAVKWTQDHKRVKSIDSQHTDVEIPFHFRNVMFEETLIGEDCCRTCPDTTTLLLAR